MPRRRALRVLGGALVSVAVSGVVSRSARATPRACADCTTTPQQPQQCGYAWDPPSTACTPLCCRSDDTCCKWDGVYIEPPPNPPFRWNGRDVPAHTHACCPSSAPYCGCIQEGEPHCRSSASVLKSCGTKCCRQDEFCADAGESLCCKTGEVRCGRVCCPGGSCANPSTSLCCKPGQNPCGGRACCNPSQQCTGSTCGCFRHEWKKCGEFCCKPRTEVCAARGGRRFCCPTSRWNRQTRTCCPPRTYPVGKGCCHLSLVTKNCCRRVRCPAGQTCVDGRCRDLS
jgi:hypothetical protein